MPKYVFSYHRAHDREVDHDNAADWYRWFESIRANVVEIGQPVGVSRRLGNVDGDQIVSGYSIISAESLDHATELANGCPALKMGEGLEIGELLEVPAVA